MGYGSGYINARIYGASDHDARSAGAQGAGMSALFAAARVGYNEFADRSARPYQYESNAEAAKAIGEGNVVTGVRPLRYSGGVMLESRPYGMLDQANMEFIHEELFAVQNGELVHLGYSHAGLIADPYFDISKYRFSPVMGQLTVNISSLQATPGFPGSAYRFFWFNCQDFVDTARAFVH